MSSLSDGARVLLLAAARDPYGQILKIDVVNQFEVSTNGRQFVDYASPRSRAKWESAVDELAARGLVRDAGYKGSIFQVTNAGYEVAESLGK